VEISNPAAPQRNCAIANFPTYSDYQKFFPILDINKSPLTPL
jgi:hypothetical protein